MNILEFAKAHTKTILKIGAIILGGVVTSFGIVALVKNQQAKSDIGDDACDEESSEETF